ncbi:MAG: type II toxin-antitoxin system VapC family toxin [Clostridiales Family XIII bacterium]|jgi:tRNA(fMet)-specific endonuclease VapC|nr:type II toxin-antitoxin system VapC family toxin [Clostridiales Family XIII bacterium]
MTYFLDTNICIYLLKGTSPALTKRLLRTIPMDVKIPSIVYAELLAGAKASGSPEKSIEAIKAFVSQFEIVPFDETGAEAYGRIRAGLLAAGVKGGPNDMIVVATALSRGGVIVTNNEKDFLRFAGVQTENWTRRASPHSPYSTKV